MQKDLPINHSSVQCYYCKAQPAENKGIAKISLYGNITRAYRKVEFQSVELVVPRCISCKRSHTLVDSCAVLAIIVLLPLTVGLDFIFMPSKFVGIGVLLAILLAVIGGVILGSTFGERIFLRPRRILRANDMTSFPPAAPLLKQGWTTTRPSA